MSIGYRDSITIALMAMQLLGLSQREQMAAFGEHVEEKTADATFDRFVRRIRRTAIPIVRDRAQQIFKLYRLLSELYTPKGILEWTDEAWDALDGMTPRKMFSFDSPTNISSVLRAMQKKYA